VTATRADAVPPPVPSQGARLYAAPPVSVMTC